MRKVYGAYARRLGSMVQISVTMSEELVDQVDEVVKNSRFLDSRSAAIRFAVTHKFDLENQPGKESGENRTQ